jgi:hypothetical protein
MSSVIPLQSANAGHRFGQPAVITVAVIGGACLDAVWPELLRSVVLALKIAFYIVMSNS